MKSSRHYFIFKAIISCIFFSFTKLASQSYDYSLFRFPEVKIKALTGNVYLNGSSTSNKVVNIDTRYKELNYNINGSYNVFSFTKKTQRLSYSDFQHSFSSSGSKYDKIINFDLMFRSGSRLFALLENGGYYRFYFDDQTKSFLGIPKPFYEIDHDISLSYRSEQSKNDTITKTNNSINFYATLPLRIGFGRIEPMNDVFLAQFLMDDLKAADLIKENFSEEHLFELAQLMSFVRRQRVFDYRRANIYQLTELAKWMEKMNIPMNIQSFNVLNDNWQNAFVNTRNHGQRFSMGLIPWVDYYQYVSAGSANPSTANYGIGLHLEYNKANAISQYSQSDFTATLAHNIQKKQYYSDIDQITSINASYRYSYNPSSRTYYSLTGSIEDNIVKFNDMFASLGINASANYFLSNRIRISANMSMIYNIFKSNTYYEQGFPSINSRFRQLPGNLISQGLKSNYYLPYIIPYFYYYNGINEDATKLDIRGLVQFTYAIF